MLIRRERPADVDAIDEVHARAFATAWSSSAAPPVEVGLVRKLRAGSDWIPALSVVAQEPDGRIVGHVVCSRGHVGDRTVVGLGPIGVAPDRQGRGIGHALMHAVIAAADALDVPLIALLGEPAFYARFGFVPASSMNIAAPDRAWGDYFQVRTLTTYHLGITGTFDYAEPFSEPDDAPV